MGAGWGDGALGVEQGWLRGVMASCIPYVLQLGPVGGWWCSRLGYLGRLL